MSIPPPGAAARGLRQSMAWIHGWLGLIGGWILFTMFLTGTASYFRPEITQWMQPEQHAQPVAPAEAAQSATNALAKVGPDDTQWFIALPDARSPVTRAFVLTNPDRPDASHGGEKLLDPATGAALNARETRGGEHFYRFHFQLQLPHPWGRWLAGVCAIFMLAAIISGVVTHKRIFADFFTLRWGKGQRSWLDAHNASAVLALPFHAMITYTGLITLMLMYMPWPVTANYADPAKFGEEAYGFSTGREASGTRAPLAPIAPIVRDAERRMDAPATRIVVRNPNDAAATVAVFRHASASINARGPEMLYSGATGRLISKGVPPGPAAATGGVMLGLHIAQFAGPALRWALFALGLVGTAMVGTGLLLWVNARRRAGAKPFFGLRLVERLNIAVVAAFPIGMAAYLLANRLIPAGVAGRADMEVAAMFWTWGLLAAGQLALPARLAWRALFALGAAAFAAVPLISALTTDRGLPASIAAGDGLFVAFDLAMLVIAALLAFASHRGGRAPVARTRRVQAELAHA